jgi:hypothetical protein
LSRPEPGLLDEFALGRFENGFLRIVEITDEPRRQFNDVAGDGQAVLLDQNDFAGVSQRYQYGDTAGVGSGGVLPSIAFRDAEVAAAKAERGIIHLSSMSGFVKLRRL